MSETSNAIKTDPAQVHRHRRAEPILKVIRRKCLDCSAGQPGEVRLCPVMAARCIHTGWAKIRSPNGVDYPHHPRKSCRKNFPGK